MNTNIIDLPEIDKKLKTETKEEIEHKRAVMAAVIEKAGLRGFFHGQRTPEPIGIVLDYDIAEVQKELGIS